MKRAESYTLALHAVACVPNTQSSPLFPLLSPASMQLVWVDSPSCECALQGAVANVCKQVIQQSLDCSQMPMRFLTEALVKSLSSCDISGVSLYKYPPLLSW